MRILILGGDGYLGWSTCMYLSSLGHEIGLIDNYSRRDICRSHNISFLFDVPKLEERVNTWNHVSGLNVEVFIGDLQSWDFVANAVSSFMPDALIHYAEQPSAPYSMLDREAAVFTLKNNLLSTFNLIHAVKEFTPDAHIVKLGTMGEYGTPNIEIEEGWLDVSHKGRKARFMFPRQGGSLYHTTKIMDTDLLWFYVRAWGLRVTDLMQGPVYGIQTGETVLDEKLLPLFNYDEIFGTVINRFIVQAACEYPLTIYGKGSQSRGFLNVLDTLSCIRLAIGNVPERGELKIYNQFTEVFSVSQLAKKIQGVGNGMGLTIEIQHIDNPRIEAEEHFYKPAHTALTDLGLEPHPLSEDVIAEMLELVLKYKGNIRKDQIFNGIPWDGSH